MKHTLFSLILILFIAANTAGAAETQNAITLSPERQKTIESIRTVTSYSDFNIYSMYVFYDYNLDNLTPVGVYDTQTLMNLVFNEAIPGAKIDYKAPNYGCSAFTLKNKDGGYFMGRNYDFRFDTSAMMVICRPKNGYASIAYAALDNINVKNPFSSPMSKFSCLTAPFICLDGMNEKGVGIAVLTLDSEPTMQKTGRPVLATTILIRMVLDKAATTQEAVDLISKYDVYAICGRDYHFYITDASGDGRVVEFDCSGSARETVATPTRTVTNFFIKYKDMVKPRQKNGIYGHGRERYDTIETMINRYKGEGTSKTAMKALKAASQLPGKTEITSNTQWSVVYDLNRLTLDFVLHRRWNNVYSFKLTGNAK